MTLTPGGARSAGGGASLAGGAPAAAQFAVTGEGGKGYTLTVSAVPLTNGVVYTNTVRGNEIKYFIVAVPNEVTNADNFLSSTGPGSAGVQLLYSPLGLPTGPITRGPDPPVVP